MPLMHQGSTIPLRTLLIVQAFHFSRLVIELVFFMVSLPSRLVKGSMYLQLMLSSTTVNDNPFKRICYCLERATAQIANIPNAQAPGNRFAPA
jgi:hypothetical protein